MTETQPFIVIRFTKMRIATCRDEIEEWQKQHEDLQHHCWVWEDLISVANNIFDRIQQLDSAIQEDVLTGRMEFNEALDTALNLLLVEWIAAFEPLLSHADRVEHQYSKVDGAERFRMNLREAKGMITPDDEYFSNEKLALLRDEAIEAHRGGNTELLLDDEQQQEQSQK